MTMRPVSEMFHEDKHDKANRRISQFCERSYISHYTTVEH